MAKIEFMAAVSDNNVIGREGELPWHFAEDLRRFVKFTKKHVIIMGVNTFESLAGPLEDRMNVVISTTENYRGPNLMTFKTFEEALAHFHDEGKVYVIGGQQLFDYVLDRYTVPVINLTRICKHFDGDRFMPKFDFENEEIELIAWSKKLKCKYAFITYRNCTKRRDLND